MKTTVLDRLAQETTRRRRDIILEALRAEGGNRSRAARRLGYTSPSTFFRAVRRLGLRLPKGRPGRPRLDGAK